ncbi:hypothetical protein DFH07DRAFT_785490 [Mycena maculata]|uniref:Uncharacterized protein n=1 Tax=Mycena maculata TaxID=230809 RepID=A0AAD7HBF5_9AGAR|nr:hypothetical protein DFH07DRAFT_785490 [Mycena maculata]
MCTKVKRTQDEILDQRAQAAWEYHQRNKEAINAKARVRMRRRREELKTASSDIQQEYTVKARQYRRRYIDRHKEPPSRLHDVPKKTKPQNPMRKKPVTTREEAKTEEQNTQAKTSNADALQTAKPAQGHHGGSASPLPLRDIASEASDSSDSPEEDDDDKGWYGDTEKEELGPLLNATGHPDYVPLPGQQPYVKQGRRYWF